jgi:hypothetical protein
MSTRGASGRPGSRIRVPASYTPKTPLDIGAISAEWAPTAGRILLGAVFFWFGHHELIQPGHCPQYVPVTGVSDTAVRDLGVLGLAVCLTGCKNQRLVLRG